MIFYDIVIDLKSELMATSFINSLSESSNRNFDAYENCLYQINKVFDGSINNEILVVQAYKITGQFLYIACCCKVENREYEIIADKVESTINQLLFKGIYVKDVKEVTSKVFSRNIRLAESMSGFEMKGSRKRRTWVDDFNVDYLSSDSYKVKEYVFDALQSKNAIFKEAGDVMGDASLYEELGRIYATPENYDFYGIPVHYRVVASSRKSAEKIIEILVSALHKVNRLLGTRVSYMYDYRFGAYFDDEELESLFEKSVGTAIAFELFTNDKEESNVGFADNQLWRGIKNNICEYYDRVLIIFVDILSERRNDKKALLEFADDLNIIEIKEGIGSVQELEKFLLRLMEKSKYKRFLEKDELSKLLSEEKNYNITMAYEIYDKWNKNVLKEKAYPAYRSLEETMISTVSSNKYYDNGLEKLNSLIGLRPVKNIVKQMIATYAMQKTRQSLGLDQENFSRHMIFTGNPGVAKTTVARMLSRIFAEKGITETPIFVECGRSDLVGKYVGWTANVVKEKFKAARGGIIFIDEAYALVDGSNTFGDEAINTIVQEMENHRDDVIVIFAGYPDKMKDFLDKNEGLRSRIVFHINFPDYNEEELCDILRLMVKDKSYTLEDSVIERCKEVFKSVCKHPEFGNGRFVRNMLEQAIMKQSLRIYETYGNKNVSKKEVCTLKSEDFDGSVAMPFSTEGREQRRSIGFMA